MAKFLDGNYYFFFIKWFFFILIGNLIHTNRNNWFLPKKMQYIHFLIFNRWCVRNFQFTVQKLEVTEEHKTFIMELNFYVLYQQKCSYSVFLFMFSLNAIFISPFQLFISIIIIFCFFVFFSFFKVYYFSFI